MKGEKNAQTIAREKGSETIAFDGESRQAAADVICVHKSSKSSRLCSTILLHMLRAACFRLSRACTSYLSAVVVVAAQIPLTALNILCFMYVLRSCKDIFLYTIPLKSYA